MYAFQMALDMHSHKDGGAKMGTVADGLLLDDSMENWEEYPVEDLSTKMLQKLEFRRVKKPEYIEKMLKRVRENVPMISQDGRMTFQVLRLCFNVRLKKEDDEEE